MTKPFKGTPIRAALAALAAIGLQPLAQAQAPEPLAPSQPTAAQPATASDVTTLETVTVTAQKRKEDVEDVPIPIRAFSGLGLAQEGITTPAELTRLVPSLKVSSSIGTLATRLAIRGIGTFGNSAIEPSVATFINGIYVPRPASIINSLLDVEAVEVLSGPQGTLFGRNASVGAFAYRTGTPTGAYGGAVKAEYATGDRKRVEGVYNFPLGDKLSFRVAALYDDLGGYWRTERGDARFGGLKLGGGRITALADITPDLVWTVRADYQRTTGDGTLNGQLDPNTLTPTTFARFTSELLGNAPTRDQYGRRNNLSIDNNHVNDKYGSASSDLAWTVGGGFTVRLLNAYNHWDAPQSDGDTAVLPIYVVGRNLHYKSTSQSHELQLISPTDRLMGGRLDFVAGLYYLHEDYGIRIENLNGPNFCDVLVPLPGLAGPFAGVPGATTAAKIASCKGYGPLNSYGDFRQWLSSAAAYAQATFKVVPTVALTGGIRYTSEKKGGHYDANVVNPTGRLFSTIEDTALDIEGRRPTYRGNLSWRPDANNLFFATVSTGFKSGGFNNGVGTVNLGQQRIFNAETVKNYEVGAKSQLLDRRLIVNATVFRMMIDNYQERGATGLTATTRNVGAVRQQGVELDGAYRVMPHVKLDAAVTYLDSKVLSYCGAPLVPYLTSPAGSCPGALANARDAKGERLNFNPRWQGNVGAALDGALMDTGFRWLVRGDAQFNSRQNLVLNLDNGPLTQQSGYTLFNARGTVSAPKDAWSVSLYGRNLTNKGYCTFKAYQTLEGPFNLRYDANGDGVNDGTAVRCFVGPPRVIGVVAAAQF